RVLTRMLDHDARVATLAEHIPQRFAKGAGARRPGRERCVVAPIRDDTPVGELAPVDVALGTEVDAVLPPLRAGGHRDRYRALGVRDLDRLGAEATRTAPDEHDVVLRNGV